MDQDQKQVSEVISVGRECEPLTVLVCVSGLAASVKLVRRFTRLTSDSRGLTSADTVTLGWTVINLTVSFEKVSHMEV